MQNFGDLFDPYAQGAPGGTLGPVDWSWMLGGLNRPSMNNGGVLAPGNNPFGISFGPGPQPPQQPPQQPPGGVLSPPGQPPMQPPIQPPVLPPVLPPQGIPPMGQPPAPMGGAVPQQQLMQPRNPMMGRDSRDPRGGGMGGGPTGGGSGNRGGGGRFGSGF